MDNMIAKSAITIAADGSNKAKLLAMLTGHIELTTNKLPRGILQLYFRRNLSGIQLRNSLGNGTIHDVVSQLDYAVIYYRCLPTQCFNSPEVVCSYRATILGNFVLVHPANQTTSTI